MLFQIQLLRSEVLTRKKLEEALTKHQLPPSSLIHLPQLGSSKEPSYKYRWLKDDEKVFDARGKQIWPAPAIIILTPQHGGPKPSLS
jgi:hypothetical protein